MIQSNTGFVKTVKRNGRQKQFMRNKAVSEGRMNIGYEMFTSSLGMNEMRKFAAARYEEQDPR